MGESTNSIRKELNHLYDAGYLEKVKCEMWFGHVMRKDDDDWVKKCMNLEVAGTAPRGNRKTWRKTVDADMKMKGLKVEDCANRIAWRKGVKMLRDNEGFD